MIGIWAYAMAWHSAICTRSLNEMCKTIKNDRQEDKKKSQHLDITYGLYMGYLRFNTSPYFVAFLFYINVSSMLNGVEDSPFSRI